MGTGDSSFSLGSFSALLWRPLPNLSTLPHRGVSVSSSLKSCLPAFPGFWVQVRSWLLQDLNTMWCLVMGGVASPMLDSECPRCVVPGTTPPPVFTMRFKCVAVCGKECSLHIDSLCRVSAFPRPQLLLKSIQPSGWFLSQPSLPRASCLSAGEGCPVLLFPYPGTWVWLPPRFKYLE